MLVLKRPVLSFSKLYQSQALRYYTTENGKFNILFFGTDLFSVTTLKKLIEHKKAEGSTIKNLCVVTPPLKKTGRGLKETFKAPLLDFAEKNGIQAFTAPPKTLSQWELPALHENGSKVNFDLAVVSSFGYFIPKRIIDQFPSGAINIHPSLLPKYRGASPIQYTIMNEDRFAGVSIQKLDPHRMDTGSILRQEFTATHDLMFREDLELHLADYGGDILVSTLQNFKELYESAIEQDPRDVSFAPKITTSLSVISWETDCASKIYAKYRAFGDKIFLRSSFEFKSKTKNILFYDLDHPFESPKPPKDAVPGMILFDASDPEALGIVCADKSVINVRRVKVEGKSITSIKDFVNGYNLKRNTKLF